MGALRPYPLGYSLSNRRQVDGHHRPRWDYQGLLEAQPVSTCNEVRE
jgi:hypothetical protein